MKYKTQSRLAGCFVLLCVKIKLLVKVEGGFRRLYPSEFYFRSPQSQTLDESKKSFAASSMLIFSLLDGSSGGEENDLGDC